MKKPNFFIIGAPKCGTTSIAYWLAKHPEVFMSSMKEPSFFNTDGFQYVSSLKSYDSLFEKADGSIHKAVGEGSTNYLYSKNAVTNILKYNPDSKFIVCLRNPVEMAPALHGEHVFHLGENVTDFSQAWSLQEEREKGKNIPPRVRGNPDLVLYRRYSQLGEQLGRLFGTAGRDRVHIILLDDLKISPRSEWLKLCSFLNVNDDARTDFPVQNSSKRFRFSAIRKLELVVGSVKSMLGVTARFGLLKPLTYMNVKNELRENLPSELLVEMSRYFEEDIKVLENLIGRDLSHWRYK